MAPLHGIPVGQDQFEPGSFRDMLSADLIDLLAGHPNAVVSFVICDEHGRVVANELTQLRVDLVRPAESPDQVVDVVQIAVRREAGEPWGWLRDVRGM